MLLAASCDKDPNRPDGRIRALDVVPANAWLVTGSTLQLETIATDSTGAPTTVAVRWSSSDTRVVSVSSTGVASAVALGTATILAEAEGLEARSVVTVTAAAPVSWSIEHEGVTDASLLGVWADPGSSLAVVAGQAGTIMESTNGTWQRLQLPTMESFTGVWGSSATNVFAVGNGGVIFRR